MESGNSLELKTPTNSLFDDPTAPPEVKLLDKMMLDLEGDFKSLVNCYHPVYRDAIVKRAKVVKKIAYDTMRKGEVNSDMLLHDCGLTVYYGCSGIIKELEGC